ncbi:MAG: lipid kinase [Pseudonocardiaceae bacterium]|nr:lipid kinase [Pseudonocardiaceae bacterium]
MGTTRLLVLSNAKAGSTDEGTRAEVLQALRTGADVVTVTPRDPADIDRHLADHPERRPVALGGDGTLHLLVAALYARGELASCAVGLVPLGTGNDVARTLGIPLDPVAAAAVVLDGRDRELDALVGDDGRIVINAIHLGVGARGSQDARPLKPWLGHRAYRIGALIAGLRTRGWPVTVIVDGRQLCDGRRRALMIGIGNGRSIGGGTPLTPHALPDDGLADVVVSTATGPLSRLSYGWRLRGGRHEEMRQVVAGRGRVVSVSGPPLPINSDGELGAEITRRTWTVAPRAWRITVPR